MITRMLLASVLAIGASNFAGCGDTDCPASFTPGSPCTAAGLSCTTGGLGCTCTNGGWACDDGDLPFPIVRDMATHDLANPSD
jgi:hypothetical protein